MRKLITLLMIGFVSVGAWGQWATSGPSISTNSNEIFFNYANNGTSTLWLNRNNSGPGTRGHYYIKAFDYWGAYLHFVGTGDQDNERMTVTFDGKVGIGTDNPQEKFHIVGGNMDIGDKTGEYSLRFRRLSDSAPVGQIGLSNTANFRFSHYGGGGHFTFCTNYGDQVTEKVRIANNGNVGIGTSNPQAKLAVNGTILAKEVKVSTDESDWPDFVFSDTYDLKDLSEVESFIKTNKHLENIPSATDMEEQGVNLAEMNKLLLQKIEELTLYAIEKDKEVQSQKLKVEKLEADRKMEQGERQKMEKNISVMENELHRIKEMIINNLK